MDRDFEEQHRGIARSEYVRKLSRRQTWNVSPRARQDALDYLESVIADGELGAETKLKAVETLLRVDMFNLAAEKVDMIEDDEAEKSQHVVLLLPPNGTEAEA